MQAHHALVLNLHQPAGNLESLLEHQTWEAKEILFAMDRIPRSLWGHEDLARVHLSLSGTLLESLANPGFQDRVYGIVDCGTLLWHLQNTALFDILGTGYYHPVLPLIPEADRAEHLQRWQAQAGHLFWRPRFDGFWPPEMGFSMELIPLLAAAGYRYVLVDSEHVEPAGKMNWQELRYRPHVARYEDAEITVIVRDRELSDAQESGMDLDWFLREVAERTRWCDFPPLVTTATDGENGGWFRNVTAGANFWSAFYLPLLERVRSGDAGVKPTFIRDYLDVHGTFGEVRVHTGAWNTGWHHGRGFTQWTGSEAQRRVIERYQEVSDLLHRAAADVTPAAAAEDRLAVLEEARWRLLRAETSCNTYWGEAWVGRADADLDAALRVLTDLQPLHLEARPEPPPVAASASTPDARPDPMPDATRSSDTKPKANPDTNPHAQPTLIAPSPPNQEPDPGTRNPTLTTPTHSATNRTDTGTAS